MLIIPAIDLKDGQCVRLKQGAMDNVTVFSDNPATMALKWVEEGARRIHLVDLDGAVAGKPKNADVIAEIARAVKGKATLQLGGGIRDTETIEWYLTVGIHQVIIGTAAVKDPDFVKEACWCFANKIIVGIDAREGKIATDGWEKTSDIDAIEFAKVSEKAGVSAIIYTDIARDGMLSGVNWEATKALADAVSIPVIASGGIAKMEDIEKLCEYAETNLVGAITGRAIYEGSLNYREAAEKAALVGNEARLASLGI